MANYINGVKVPFVPITKKEEVTGKKTQVKGQDFDSIFKKELEQLKFSSHATKRLESRNIQISEIEMNKLQEAVGKAEMKGARDSLVMMDKTAFIVNVPNKTVVTAMPVGQGEENVFTNIDSVVFTD